MSRFVIDGFSAAVPEVVFCGSEGGAAWPLSASVLGTASASLCVVGCDSGDPMADEVCDNGGEGRPLSEASESRGAATVAMMKKLRC